MANHSNKSAAPASIDHPGAYTHAFEVETSDDDDLPHVTDALFVGFTGPLKVTMAGGETVTLGPVPGGTLLPLGVRKIFKAGTSAAGLVGFY